MYRVQRSRPTDTHVRGLCVCLLAISISCANTACKKLSGGCWRGYLSGARCTLAYGPAAATATHCLKLGFTFLVPAHPVVPDKGPLNRCVCVCVTRINKLAEYIKLLHLAG